MLRMLLLFSLFLSGLNSQLTAQIDPSVLIGDWERIPDNYQQSTWAHTAETEVPKTYLSFDADWKYAQQADQSVHVEAYQLHADTLLLERATFWIKRLTASELVLAHWYEGEVLTTISFRRLAEPANQLERLQEFVNQDRLGPFNLRGYYQLQTLANPSEPIEGGDILVHNFRFYPDQQVLYVRNGYSTGTEGPFPCDDCTLDYEGWSSWSGNALPLNNHASTSWSAQLELPHKTLDFKFRMLEDQLFISLDGQAEKAATFVPFDWVPFAVKELADFTRD
ncbi:MAG: hypothetical protein AAF433_22290 [Bacteroidota bacterium]